MSLVLSLPPDIPAAARALPRRWAHRAAMAVVASAAMAIAVQGFPSQTGTSTGTHSVAVPGPILAENIGRFTAEGGIAGLLALPVSLQVPINQSLSLDHHEFRISSEGGIYRAVSPTYGFTTTFTQTGPRVSLGEHSLGMGTAALGRGRDLRTVEPVAPVRAGPTSIVFDHGGVTEEDTHGPLGLAQKFTIEDSPKGGNGPLTLALDSSGGLVPAINPDGRSATFSDNGSPIFGYRGLIVSDGAGRVLPSWLDVHDGRLVIRADDKGAVYPVTVDPFVTAVTVSSPGQFGYSVAVERSPAQVTQHRHIWVAVGNPTAENNLTGETQGAVRLFVGEENGSNFHSVRTVTSGANGAKLGYAVDLRVGAIWYEDINGYIDEATYVAGAPGLNNTGWLYVGTWVEDYIYWDPDLFRLVFLRNPAERPGDRLGESVAISGNGRVVVAGQPGYDGSNGAVTDAGGAQVWKTTNGWDTSFSYYSKQTLVANSAAAGDQLGAGVDVSDDGSTVIVGARLDDNASGKIDDGSANIYLEPAGAGWLSSPASRLPAAHLAASNASSRDEFGGAVAISGDGSTAVVGARVKDLSSVDQGAAYVFNRPGLWSGNLLHHAMLRKGTGPGWADNFGFSVAVSDSGYRILIGARLAEDASGEGLLNDEGAAFLYFKPLGGWYGTITSYRELLHASDEIAGGQFGSSVGLTSDGNSAVGATRNSADNSGKVELLNDQY